MARFVVGAFIAMLAVLFAISLITFAIFNLIPNGDPAYASPAARRRPASSTRSAARGASTSRSPCSTCG